jgi:hypothetical protein
MRTFALLFVVIVAGCDDNAEVIETGQAGAAGSDAAAAGGTAGSAGSAGQAEDAGDTDGGGWEWPAGAEAACASFAAHDCVLEKPCLGTEYFKGEYGDDAGCVGENTRWCLHHFFQPGATFTVDAMQACVAAVTQIDRCPYLWPTACQPGPGTKENGAACGADPQCKSGFCCAHAFACGTCCPAPQVNEPCWDYACGAGLGCEVPSEVCVPESQEGEPCGTMTVCAGSLTCQQGVCVKYGLAHEGEACTLDACAGYLMCSNTTSTCESISHFSAAEGEPCNPADGSEVCQHGLACQIGPPAICVAGAKPGEPCAQGPFFTQSNCGNLLACIGGACVERIPASCP